MSRTIKELHILVGLPGSGKTTFADTLKAKFERSCFVIDFDKIYRNLKSVWGARNDEYRLNYVRNQAIPYSFVGEIIVADGLFLTQKDIIWLIDMFNKSDYFTKKYSVKKWIIDYWIPDIESCLWNDKGRRRQNSEISITNLTIEKPNISEIEQNCDIHNVHLCVHSVKRKPRYVSMAVENGLDDARIKKGKFFESCSWSLGGEGRSWNGEPYYISPEAPCEFVELDNLLESIAPSLTFMHYKKLFRRCVTLEERDSSDYYSQSQEAYYLCNLEELYTFLEEHGYIQ